MAAIDIADTSPREFPEQEPIAVIGIGCRYSGDIHNLDDFWRMLIERKSTLSDVPDDRFSNVDALIDPERGMRKIVTGRGGWLQQLKDFDAKFFRISPREAEKIDPHQRLMLEVTFEALEDAGLKLEDVWGSRTGVYAGMWSSDFEHVLTHSKDDIDVYSTTGSGRYAASGRLAYFFNLQGPTFTIDTACSTSLVAVHLAAQSLHLNECDMAICSAANLILNPFISVGYSRSRLLSDYGKCRFGAKDASGYVRTEGAATVVLKRLSDAQRDGDPIYAIVPGSACNSDGQSHKYMLAPSAITQEIMIKDALKRARLSPSLVQYVEAHGTGTKAGDPAELASIPAALSEKRDPSDIFYVGSIKTNLGHTEAASGFAGMIKTILAIQNRLIPGNLYAEEDKNPNIPWDKIPLKIPAEATPWPHPERPLLAGVNSFGISGTNAHVLLQEAPKQLQAETNYHRQWKVFPLSAANEAALKVYASKYLEALEKMNNEKDLFNFTKNVSIRKADLQQRAIVLFENKQDLIKGLEALKNDSTSDNLFVGYAEERRGTALVFPGQGAQWNGMGKSLYDTEPVFKNAIDDCAKAFSKYVSWNLCDELFSPDGMETIDIIQPALVAVEIALAKWWEASGAHFKAVIGHSMGEVAAAYLSQKITLDEAALIICTRSRLMKKTSGQGAMGYIALSPDEVNKRISGKENQISIGVNNSPSSTVISGDPSTVDAILAATEAEGIFSRRIKVNVASHSPQMDGLLEDLSTTLQNLLPTDNSIDFYSTVHASIQNGTAMTSVYWTANLRNTVRFAETLQLMAADGYSHFIEVSPHPTLLQAIQENSDVLENDLTATGSLEREKDEQLTLLRNFSNYFVKGGRVNWKKFYGTDYTRITLPAYPFQRERYWVEETGSASSTGLARKKSSKTHHPFLMQQMETPEGSDLYIWETSISTASFPYMTDHKIQEAVVMPGAAYIEMLLAVAEEMSGSGKHILKDVVLNKALTLKDQEPRYLQIVLKHRIAESFDAYIYSLEANEEQEEWVENAVAVLHLNSNTDRLLPNALPVDIIERTTDRTLSSSEHYMLTAAIDLPYGPVFQTVREIKIGENFILADVAISDKAKLSASKYLFHPSLLDGCIQAFLSAVYQDEGKSTFVPVSAGKIELHHYEKSITSCTAAIKITAESHNYVTGNAVIYGQDGQVLLEMRDFTLERLEQSTGLQESLDQLLYEVVYSPAELPQMATKKVLLFCPENESTALEEAIQPAFIVKKGDSFRQEGNIITIHPEKPSDYSRLLEIIGHQIDTIVHAWTFDANDLEGIHHQVATTLSIAKLAKALSEANLKVRLWVLANDLSVHPAQAPALGMLHVMRNEHPEFQASSIQIIRTDWAALTRIIHSDTKENTWLLNGIASVARLQHPAESTIETVAVQEVAAGSIPFEAVTHEPGILENIVLRKKSIGLPAPHEVQIEVKALGINFMNLMSALGIYPGKEKGFATLGIECAGVVKTTGSQVTHLKPGDKVMGMAYHTMSSHINVDAGLMQHIPEGMSFEDAATIPVVFLTVYYSLVTLGRLQPGERVLIHAATGGVGLAAIQVAKHIGAEIFATAGSKTKRDMLRNMGIEYVYDSRTSDFGDRIMRDTSGEGVDVVLNSLTGDAMLESLNLLRSFGRFVEIGKKDVYADSRVGLKAFSKGLSYFMVDFEKMIFEKPAYVGTLLGEIVPYFKKGVYLPLEKKVFHIRQAQEAFAFMSSGQHTGKIVIQVNPEGVMLHQDIPFNVHLDAEATYLLTGGYGGLGLTFAHYLADKGASSLILTGRSGPSESAQYQIDLLEAKGVHVRVEKMDAGKPEDIQRVLNDIPQEKPLKGILHLAGLLEDAALMNLDEAAFYRVLHPKVSGAYHLHAATQQLSLDHFILFSSSTILFGSPGQTAYVAANSYMDALAEYRRKNGLPALSIQWGTVADVGLAAAAGNRADRLSDEGVAPLSPAECTVLLELAYLQKKPVMGAFRFDIQKWQSTYTAAAGNPFYDNLRTSSENGSDPNNGNKDELSFTDFLSNLEDAESRHLAVEEKLREKVGTVVKLNPDQISNKTPFKSLGIDSLMSIQLKNQLEKTFDTTISVTSFWTYPNIRDYAKFLLDKLQLNNTVAEIKTPINTPITTQVNKPEEVVILDEDVSLDDLSKLLEDELNDI